MKQFTPAQKKVLDGLWVDVEWATEKYWRAISAVEERAQKELEIDICVFHVDGEAVGFGDSDRGYKLYDISTKPVTKEDIARLKRGEEKA